MKCYRCGDKGEIGGCPDCGKVLALGQKGNVTITEEVLDRHVIPTEYLNVTWDVDLFKRSHPLLIDSQKGEYYIDQLTKIIDIFKRGELPQQSAIIISERGMAKKTFGYICMKLAIANGYSVCPMLDNTEIKRINELSADNYKSWALYKLPKIEDVIGSDVLFLTVDYDRYSTALRTIESVIDKRARHGRATIVLTRFSLKAMSQYEKDKYISLIEQTRGYNNKKYPVIISCEEEY